MTDYSLRQNLRLMAMAFCRPRSVVEFFLANTLLLYSLVPLVAFTLLFEISYVLDYFLKAPGFIHLFAKVFGIPDVTYNLYQVFLIPIIHVIDFFLYAAVIHTVSRLLSINALDTAKVTLFFVFIWNTIGLLGFFTENMAVWGGIWLLFYAQQPLFVAVYALYPMEFIHHMTGASRWRSVISSTLALVVFLGFRVLFVG